MNQTSTSCRQERRLEDLLHAANAMLRADGMRVRVEEIPLPGSAEVNPDDPTNATLQVLMPVISLLVPLIQRLERAVERAEKVLPSPRCDCSDPHPVVIAQGYVCTDCGGNWWPLADVGTHRFGKSA